MRWPTWERQGMRTSVSFHCMLLSIYLLFLAKVCIYWSFECIILPACLSLPHSRCPASISTWSNVWGGVSRKQWPALTSCVTGVRCRPNSCCPALSFPLYVPLSCFSLFQASCNRELFVLTSPLLSADLWNTKDLDSTLATHTRAYAYTMTTASISFLILNPHFFVPMRFLKILTLASDLQLQ